MNDQDVVGLLIKGQTVTMMAVVAVAGQFAETLIRKGVLTVADAQSTLSNIAEELRDDGDADGRQLADPAFRIANDLDARAVAIGEKFGKAT
jgi:hypothetical protein